LIVRFLGSLKPAIFILIGLLILSVLGTLLPRSAPGETAAPGSRPSVLLAVLKPGDIYRSPLFLGLLFLFSLNITVCTLTRLGPKIRRATRPSLEADADALLASPDSAKLRFASGLREAAAAVGRTLRRRGFRVRESGASGRLVLLGRKRTAGLFGPDVVHLGLLVVVAGGIASGLAGFRTTIALEEGRTETVPRAGINLRLDKFEVETYADGSVKDWKSRLTVLENGRPIGHETVEVNHPLSHKGFLIYQSGWAPVRERPRLGLSVSGYGGDGFRRDITARPGEPAPLGERGLSLTVVRFLPDFVMNERREALSRSDEPLNPAAMVEITKDGETVHRGWTFGRYPDYGGTHSRGDADYGVAFVSLDYDLLSILEAARDPGASFIWAGCGLVMAGLFLAFYWPPREIRVLIETASGRTVLTAAASGRKSREALSAEFKSLAGEWKGMK